MLINKSIALIDCDLKMVGDSGRFEGYASVFNVKDLQGDVVKPGAYKASLAKFGMPKMFYDHRWDMPIGRYEDADERAKGLYVVGEMTPGHSRAADVAAAMRHKTLDGLSVGGYVGKGDFTVENDTRFINVWSKLIEISPTTFPANEKARITGIKHADADDLAEAIADIESIRDLERFLRDAGSFSKGAATALVARVKAVLGVEGEPAAQSAEAKALSDVLARVNALGGRLPG